MLLYITMASLMTKDKKQRHNDKIFSSAICTTHVVIPITAVGKNIAFVLSQYVSNKYEGYCIVEGYVKPGSVNIITHSSGEVIGQDVKFEVVYQIQVCHPVEGMIVDCLIKNITKAGIRAEIPNYDATPMVIFIARDHHFTNEYFNTLKEGENTQVRVIGQRFELNDTFVSVIGELINPKEAKTNMGKKTTKEKPKKRLVIEE